jgi:hypothetical protein
VETIKKLWKYLAFDTWGWVATASLLICAVSGVLLTVPYDVTQPYLSVTRLVTANPAASYVRNLHYWSAQLFLILTFVHLFDHLLKGSELNIRMKGIWFRLSFSLIFVFYAMISGFILKADGDSLQAQRILDSLIRGIPGIGNMLADTFVGLPGKFQGIYIQHAATATIIIFVVVLEHARSLVVNLKTFVITTLILGSVSLFFRAPVNGLNDEIMKGPWYFIGLQEILHWLPRPVYASVGLGLLLLLLYFYYHVKTRAKQFLLKFFFGLLLAYVILTITGLFFRGVMWQWQWPWSDNYRSAQLMVPDRFSLSGKDTYEMKIISGGVEGCMSCHGNMTGFSESHKPEYIGCYSCHGGDPRTLNKSLAHRGMYAVPGNLSNASVTCGNTGCHPAITERVPESLMATLSGIISVDRWVFGQNQKPLGLATVKDIGHNSAADVHLRNLCAGCHLGSEKLNPGPPEWIDRGGGCNACHLTYDRKALATLNSLKKGNFKNSGPAFHPAIDLNITNDHCQSCHSRSGRISMNYEGWHETTLKPVDVKGRNDLKVLPDKRVFSKQPADVHHTAGMLCIDCHGSSELMGDGNRYMHKEDAVKVQCSDCHALKAYRQESLAAANQETQLIAWLRGYKVEGVEILLTQKSGQALVNTRVEGNGRVLSLIKKSGGTKVLMKPPAAVCSEGKAHTRLSCEACHTAWAPQCIGCHNSYEPKTMGFDMLSGKTIKGTWVEYAAEGMAEQPVLGVIESDKSVNGGKISTFIPGMIMTIDKGSFNKNDKREFHRLYAPASAHTTQKQGRSCESCHNNPSAIGYGRGTLRLSKTGIWSFDALYADSKYDGLPEDAWTGFLKDRKGPASTRVDSRPFTLAEQKKILTVGACLTCHNNNSRVMKDALKDFEKVISHKSKDCIVPFR